VAAVEDAKSADDFKDACNEFQQATTVAPWLANGYRNLAIAQDKAGMYDEALTSLRLYLLTRPSSTDADWAEDLKSKVEYRKERIAKAKEEENSPQAVAAREQKSFEDLLSRMDGRRYTGSDSLCWVNVLDIKGRSFVQGQIGHPVCPTVHQGYAGGVPFEIQGRVTSHTDVASNAVLEFTYTINENSNSITVHTKTTVTSGPYNRKVYEYDDVYR
jgi:tetratricopeptide (TPR) repeat protein